MKKKGFIALSLFFIAAVLISGCSKTDGNLKKIQLNEVAHSVFYAPQYVALELGYFKEEGLNVELVTGFGADKTMAAVLSGDADIGFMGSEASIYVYNEGAEDYVVNFAQLTQRAGNFLVSRDTKEDFKWDNLKGKTVIGGRAGGMPQMVLEYILKKKNFDIKNDLTIIQNIDFGVTGEAFTSGTGDYTVEFEPTATEIEKSGKGKVVASLGVESGMVPYTSYAAKKSYIEENGDTIQKFTNGIQKGIEYVNKHTPEEIAKVIAPQFPEMKQQDLVTIITRYYDQETWKANAVFEEESLNLLLNIIEEAGEITKRPPYEDIITTEFAKDAAGN